LDTQPTDFPAKLLEWAGHRAGGVKRLFDESSGRPSGALIKTPLIRKLETWVKSVAVGEPGTPHIVLLVGGPGNGKTEAIEHTILELDAALGLAGGLRTRIQAIFSPIDGKTVPRTASVNVSELGASRHLQLQLVQDASVGDSERTGSAASLLVSDLESALKESGRFVFLGCVNRGVLDDALIHAIDTRREKVRTLLEAAVRAAGTSAAAPSCWPLAGYPEVAAWPMDLESLAEHSAEGTQSPFLEILGLATIEERWPRNGTCPAGSRCPFCMSRTLLSSETNSTALANTLRAYELATGKRWSFRELFTIVSFALAGAATNDLGSHLTSCEYAAKLSELDQRPSGRPESVRLAAPFLLVASQYQHALFGKWVRPSHMNIRSAIRELKLESNRTLMGLHYFLGLGREASVPTTLKSLLNSLCEALDPALADPEIEIPLSGRTSVRLRELDARFSHSVREGFTYLNKYRCLSQLESELLSRLADADDELSRPEVRQRKSSAAVALQNILRDYSCRLVRRSLGVRSGITRDHATLVAFKDVVDGKEDLIHYAVKQVENLLNQQEKFVVTLNTTFGEPLPPTARRAVLTTAKQRVKPRPPASAGRPQSDVRFLDVGTGASTQSIPLTFELFRSVTELRSGLLTSALPKTVVALLDTTRARLAGRIVRDEDQLDGSEIRIGNRKEIIVRELQKFVIRDGTAS